jgi:hypothetical protein
MNEELLEVIDAILLTANGLILLFLAAYWSR